jgi:hypothetical protein
MTVARAIIQSACCVGLARPAGNVRSPRLQAELLGSCVVRAPAIGRTHSSAILKRSNLVGRLDVRVAQHRLARGCAAQTCSDKLQIAGFATREADVSHLAQLGAPSRETSGAGRAACLARPKGPEDTRCSQTSPGAAKGKRAGSSSLIFVPRCRLPSIWPCHWPSYTHIVTPACSRLSGPRGRRSDKASKPKHNYFTCLPIPCKRRCGSHAWLRMCKPRPSPMLFGTL